MSWGKGVIYHWMAPQGEGLGYEQRFLTEYHLKHWHLTGKRALVSDRAFLPGEWPML